MPIAAGLAEKTEMALPMVAAAVVGGAFFGDNLSFISDTTIVATQTQGCKLSDKFRFNVLMVLPAALIVSVLYVFMGSEATEISSGNGVGFWKVIPYLIVLVCAAAGINVLLVLVFGNLLTCVTGMLDGSFELLGWINSSLQGVMGMAELILISMIALSPIAIDNNVNVSFSKGTGSTTPKYLTNGTAVRAYGGNTMTIRQWGNVLMAHEGK